MKKLIKMWRKVIAALGMVAVLFVLFPVSQASAASNIPLCEITRTLKIGSSGEDVQCLQRYLNWAGFTVSASGIGSPGNESMYFGSLTANAVTRWQNTNSTQVLMPLGLTTGTGIWGNGSFNFYVKLVNQALGVPGY